MNLNLSQTVAAAAGNIWWWVLGIAVVVGLIWWWSAAGNRRQVLGRPVRAHRGRGQAVLRNGSLRVCTRRAQHRDNLHVSGVPVPDRGEVEVVQPSVAGRRGREADQGGA